MAPPPHVGTMREKPLHASLKRWYAEPGDLIEEPIDGFVVDLVRNDLLIEIQTRGFSGMRRKVTSLLDLGHRMRIVHPVAAARWIVKLDDAGTELSRRRSPKRGSVIDVFAELVSFPQLVTHPGLELEIVVTHEEEVRRHEPGRAWRRNGWVVVERRLVGVVDAFRVMSADDLAGLLPADMDQPFTTAELAEAIGRPRRLAQQMAYCLREAGALEPVGKQGNSVEYRVA